MGGDRGGGSGTSSTFDASESIRKLVSRSRKRIHKSSAGEMTSSSMSGNTRHIRLEGIAWKRRSGLGKLSETVGVGKSWERRRFVLHAEDGGSNCKLCYYALDSVADDEEPRGTLTLLSERATICATHMNDTTQPTPYSLSIKTTDGISPEITKWKLCFDDRRSQMGWLVALTDAVVESSVHEFNAHKLSAEADKWEHGGFHRLYEEGEGGMFEAWKGILVGNNDSSRSSENSYVAMESFEDMANTTKEDKDTSSQHSISASSASAAAAATAISRQSSANAAKSVSDGYYVPPERFYHALAAVNLSVIYAHMTAAYTSFLIIPWWQVLIAVNICIYMCLAPPASSRTNKETKERSTNMSKSVGAELLQQEEVPLSEVPMEMKEGEDTQKQRSMNMSKSVIGAELLRQEEVPLSEVPMEMKEGEDTQKQRQKPRRVKPLSEEDMDAHSNERWALAAADVDLSGSWTLIADDAFKSQYDTYLKMLGFNRITRGVACSLVSRTSEITKQSEGGRVLFLKGTNPKGSWERTLVASGYPDFETHSKRKEGPNYQHTRSFIKTADDEDVEAEAWWEDRGKVHRSWLRGGKKYGGGDFESRRYLENGGSVLVCESTFHPRKATNERAVVTWRFRRTG